MASYSSHEKELSYSQGEKDIDLSFLNARLGEWKILCLKRGKEKRAQLWDCQKSRRLQQRGDKKKRVVTYGGKGKGASAGGKRNKAREKIQDEGRRRGGALCERR